MYEKFLIFWKKRNTYYLLLEKFKDVRIILKNSVIEISWSFVAGSRGDKITIVYLEKMSSKTFPDRPRTKYILQGHRVTLLPDYISIYSSKIEPRRLRFTTEKIDES